MTAISSRRALMAERSARPRARAALGHIRQVGQIGLLGLCGLSLAVALAGCRIERRDAAGIGEATGSAQAEPDAGAEVTAMWTTKVLPDLQRRAGDMADLRQALAAKADDQLAPHGQRNQGGEGPWNLVVKLTGKVTQVDNDEMALTLDMDTDGDGRADVQVQLGPLLKGTALRDSLSFIKFSDFPDQIAYAQLASALNERALSDIHKTQPRERIAAWKGQTITLTGVFVADNGDELPLVLPVTLAPATASAAAVTAPATHAAAGQSKASP